MQRELFELLVALDFIGAERLTADTRLTCTCLPLSH